MNKRNEMQKARAIVAASCTALGPLPTVRVVRDHLATVTGWRRQGASWDQIATILSDAGWRAKSGGSVSAQTLRAMVSRISRSQPERSRHVNTRTEGVIVPPGPSGQIGARAANPTRGDIAGRIQRAAALRSGKGER